MIRLCLVVAAALVADAFLMMATHYHQGSNRKYLRGFGVHGAKVPFADNLFIFAAFLLILAGVTWAMARRRRPARGTLPGGKAASAPAGGGSHRGIAR